MEQMKLIKRAKKGDTEAFALLYSSIYREMYRFALYSLQNSHDAEDAVSDAVMDAWAQIGSLRKEESFRSWMFAILSNKCRRKLGEYAQKTVEIPPELPVEPEKTEERMDVRTAFFKLEDQERLILAMKLFGGYNSREIGQALELNDNTVRSKQKRALEKMQSFLEE